MTASAPRPAAPDTTGGELRESLALGLRIHGQADHDPQTGTFDCRCGEFSGGFLSYHQADVLIAESPALHDLLTERDKLAAQVQAVEGLADRLDAGHWRDGHHYAASIRRVLGTPP